MRVGDTQHGANLDLNFNKITNLRDSGTRVPNDVVWDNLEDFELIGHTELSAAAANIEFDNIPGRYRHLMIVGGFQDSLGGAFNKVQFNGDTAANYDTAFFRVHADASLAGSADDGPAVDHIQLYHTSNVANQPEILFFPDYSNTTRHKSAHGIGGRIQTASPVAAEIEAHAGSGRWRSTASITKITLSVPGGNYKAGSTASLYGIRSKRFLVDPANTLCNDLIAYWKLDETGGTRLDSWGANHLTDNNTVTYARGLRGNAAQFDATNSEYLSVADNADVSTGDIDFTIAAWVYMYSKPSDDMHFVSKHDGGSANSEYAIRYFNSTGTDRLQFEVFVTAGSSAQINANNLGSPSTGTWYFIVGWHDATNNQIGIQVNNGTPDTAAYADGVRDSTLALEMGRRGDGTYSDCLIQNVGFWKKVLSPMERTVLFNNGRGNTLINA